MKEEQPTLQSLIEQVAALSLKNASLRSELEHVRQERDGLRSKLAAADKYFPDAALSKINAKERAEAAEQSRERMREALDKYGSHSLSCEGYETAVHTNFRREGECTCGFRKAMESSK